MNTLIGLDGLLVLHLTGLALMAGTTAVEYMTFRILTRSFTTERERSHGLLGLMKKLGILLGTGAALLILSGAGLLLITHGAFFRQTWFDIKLLVVLALILNGFMFGTRQEVKLKKSMDVDGVQSITAIRNLKLFYLVQMGLFFTIILLSVFKFN